MRYTLEDNLEEEEGDQTEEEEASVLEVAIPGDGDCFYLAVVEAFLREGVDVVSLFAGRMGCEVEFFGQKWKDEILSEPHTGNGQWSEVLEARSCRGNQSGRLCLPPAESPGEISSSRIRAQVNFADGLMMMECAQAGLEDFAYMEGVADEAQLKERIVVTGAEVNTQFCSTIPNTPNPRGRRYFNKGLQHIFCRLG